MGRTARKLAVLIAGVLLLAAGLAMLVLPGPGILVTLAALGLLGTEFDWARRSLASIRGWVERRIGRVAE